MSSHILSEVESLCTSLAVIHSGKMLFRGPIDGFIRQSLSSRLIVVEVGPPVADALLVSRISSVEGVRHVSANAAGLLVETEKDSDPRAEIARTVVGSGASLLGLRYSESELDEAYINAMRGTKS